MSRLKCHQVLNSVSQLVEWPLLHKHLLSTAAPNRHVYHPTSSAAPNRNVYHPTSSAAPNRNVYHSVSSAAPNRHVCHPTSSAAPDRNIYHPNRQCLSGCTGSALAWRSEGRTFASQSVQ